MQVRLSMQALRIALDETANQYRLLQKRLLAKFKDPNPTPIDQFTSLLEGAYQQVGLA
jgi:hypothetical protein